MKTVGDIMTTDVRALGRNDPVATADELHARERIRHFPVVEDGRLVGIVSQRDLLHAALSSVMGFGTKASDELLRRTAVKEVMTEEVATVSPTDTVQTAAQMMLERRIGCLPVIEDGKLVGIVSESDLLLIIAGGAV